MRLRAIDTDSAGTDSGIDLTPGNNNSCSFTE